MVFSPKVENYEIMEKRVLENIHQKLKHTNKILLVKELGKNGDHPHLNLIYDKQYNDVREYKKYWTRIIGEELVKNNPFLYGPPNKKNVKNVVSPKRLIDGYLSKESDAKVLFNNTNIQNMEQARQFDKDTKKLHDIRDELLQDIRDYRMAHPRTFFRKFDPDNLTLESVLISKFKSKRIV